MLVTWRELLRNVLNNWMKNDKELTIFYIRYYQSETREILSLMLRSSKKLYSRMVADALKAGRPVFPELFDSATIYFSDIVGFTTICGMSKPGEVVNMLNELYSQVDTVIVKHEAYKVTSLFTCTCLDLILPLFIFWIYYYIIKFINYRWRLLVTLIWLLAEFRWEMKPNTSTKSPLWLLKSPK